ncbi:MAG TPA: MBL fold metallo-hydrolase [Elusimicrobiales bacterium]|nr:MBL fold metallo-hydrolase [Elusimicrobiales bacterium]
MHKFTGLIALLLLASSNLWAQLNIYYVDVGQGDAIYIELPNGHNALIDGGPNGTAITKFLKEKNVTHIDNLVLTHPHSDHYVGLKKVFAVTDVKNFYDSRAENVNAKGDNNLRELAAAEPGCKTHFPAPGDNLNWDSRVTVKVLNSCTEAVQTHNNDETNNCSLVLRLFYNGTGLLMMGDSDAVVENAMTRIFKSGLQSYALKVGHHGSRYSSTAAFLGRVQPKVAIVSVGLDNVYGHPHKEAIDRIRATGAKIFYTTSGTQTLFIPAPKKGVEPEIIGPVPYDPATMAIPAEVRGVIYTPPVEAPVSVNIESLNQLKEAAASK